MIREGEFQRVFDRKPHHVIFEWDSIRDPEGLRPRAVGVPTEDLGNLAQQLQDFETTAAADKTGKVYTSEYVGEDELYRGMDETGYTFVVHGIGDGTHQ